VVTLGDVEISRVLDIELDNGRPEMMFAQYFADVWAAHTHLIHPADRDAAAPGGFTMSHQSWIFKVGGRTILLDTALGNDKPRNVPAFDRLDTPYLENLAAAGVRPEDVDVVAITHLHNDHVGWNTRLDNGEWAPTFPNATYYLPAPDVFHFDPANAGKVRRIPGDTTQEHVFDDSVRPILDAGLAVQWEDRLVLDDNLTMVAAPGHTPGNAVLELASGADRALFVGDMLHSPVQIALPHWTNCYCEDPEKSRSSRRATLEKAADTGTLVFAAHFGGDQAAEIARDGSAFAVSAWRP
jgi:glyoxylase-like metal-dependent hydrolase (beta-lactamase superfamily II)